MEKSVWLVENENGCLVGVYPTKEGAEKFLANHGLDSWTISEDSWC